MTPFRPNRRAILAAPVALGLAACGDASAQTEPLAPLRELAPFPVGACAMSAQLTDPVFAELFAMQFGQLTPEWEMKMEATVRADGTFDFSRADAIADFCRARNIRLHGHTVIWHEQEPPAFQGLDGDRRRFALAYRNYITALVGRYRGQAVGWDVVNEPVRNDLQGYYTGLYSRNLDDYIAEAFHIAREADPNAVLFLNEYNLEEMPQKRVLFLRLVERLLKAGAPVTGLGTQTHLRTKTAPGAVTAAIRDLASFGLPIHVSELDVSTAGSLAPDKAQSALVRETALAFAALPARQRYAFTSWGLRDKDSMLRRRDVSERPLLFDDAGRPKPAAYAFAEAVRS